VPPISPSLSCLRVSGVEGRITDFMSAMLQLLLLLFASHIHSKNICSSASICLAGEGEQAVYRQPCSQRLKKVVVVDDACIPCFCILVSDACMPFDSLNADAKGADVQVGHMTL